MALPPLDLAEVNSRLAGENIQLNDRIFTLEENLSRSEQEAVDRTKQVKELQTLLQGARDNLLQLEAVEGSKLYKFTKRVEIQYKRWERFKTTLSKFHLNKNKFKV